MRTHRCQLPHTGGAILLQCRHFKHGEIGFALYRDYIRHSRYNSRLARTFHFAHLCWQGITAWCGALAIALARLQEEFPSRHPFRPSVIYPPSAAIGYYPYHDLNRRGRFAGKTHNHCNIINKRVGGHHPGTEPSRWYINCAQRPFIYRPMMQVSGWPLTCRMVGGS
jgi:hypothetical protein